MRFNSIIATTWVLLALTGALLPMTAGADDKVVATVNGKAITDTDMRLAEAEVGADLGTLPEATRRRVLLEFLIENQLLADAAEAAKLGAGPGFDIRMNYWRRRALRDSYFDDVVKNGVGEAAALALYDDQVKALPPQEEIQARHILVESEEKAKELAEKIKGGGDFAALAKEHSKDPGTKDVGGLLGFFGKGQMVPQFEEAAFALKAGEVSGPVQSQFGWHLIKIEEKRERKPPTFEEVKDRILNALIHRKAQEVTVELRNKAKLEYLDEQIKKEVEEEAKQAEAQRSEMDALLKKQAEDDAKAKADSGEKKPEDAPALPSDAAPKAPDESAPKP